MSDSWTVLRILDWTRGYLEERGSQSPRLDAELLLASVLEMERIGLYVAYDRPLTPEERAALRILVQRRGAGEPTQYILGEQEFWSIPFRVEPGVLIPRPETELVVEEALAAARRLEEVHGAEIRIVDVGTGTGCIAVALARELPAAQIIATDVEAVPIRLARENALTAGVADRVRVVVADGLSGVDLGLGPFHVVVSNPPYIPDGDFDGLMPSVRDHEPRVALTAGPEGLDVLQRLVASCAAPEILVPGGALVLEISDDAQAQKVHRLCDAHGFDAVRIRQDYSGLSRVVVATAGIG
jgi:release factor glutamine methyltransferase